MDKYICDNRKMRKKRFILNVIAIVTKMILSNSRHVHDIQIHFRRNHLNAQQNAVKLDGKVVIENNIRTHSSTVKSNDFFHKSKTLSVWCPTDFSLAKISIHEQAIFIVIVQQLILSFDEKITIALAFGCCRRCYCCDFAVENFDYWNAFHAIGK